MQWREFGAGAAHPGDDERNVTFQQMTGLIELLRQRDVYYELIVFPDDVDESLLRSRWIYTLGRMETFLHKSLWEKTLTSSERISAGGGHGRDLVRRWP